MICLVVRLLTAEVWFKLDLALQGSLDEATDQWGIKVERVEIKDVKLPHQLQRAMAAEAEASREARAKVGGALGQQVMPCVS